MKNNTISKILFFMSALALGMVACKKDNDDSNGLMKAKIDGASWEADKVGAVVLAGLINITGQTNDGETITITIQSGQAGDYFLDENQDHAAVYQPSSGALGFVSNAPEGLGYVRVTEIDLENSTISGTFEFNGVNPANGSKKEIREGEFTGIKFEQEVVTTGPNTLSCKIDGQTFTPASVFALPASGRITISANSANMNQTIGLTLPQNVAVGEHDLSTFGDHTAQYNLNQSQFLGANSGKVNITKHDKANHKLEGTFHFEASEWLGSASATVTNGSFNVTY